MGRGKNKSGSFVLGKDVDEIMRDGPRSPLYCWDKTLIKLYSLPLVLVLRVKYKRISMSIKILTTMIWPSPLPMRKEI